MNETIEQEANEPEEVTPLPQNEGMPAAAPVPETPPEQQETVSEETIEELADGFLLLQQEVPGIDSIADVPEAVLQMAADEHLPLLDAYLRYRFREQRAVAAERDRQRRTSAQAAGSLYTGGGQSHPEAQAFARAFAQALQ